MFTRFVLLEYYLIKLYFDHKAFIADYPYMHRYWWAAVGVDFFYIIQDYWFWATLNNVSSSISLFFQGQKRN
jgi:hypothetical protein